MDTATKHQLAQDLRAQVEDVSALVLVGYNALTVKEAEDLRTRFREAGCSYKVFKNSTIRYAIQATKHEPLTPFLKGVSAIAFNAEDPGAPARVARDYAKENGEKFTLKGAVMDGTALDASGVNQLANMPGPNELKSMFLRLLQTPATNMVRVLNAVPQSMLFLLNAKKDKDAA